MTVLNERRRKVETLKLHIPGVIERISNTTTERWCLLFKALINLEIV